VRSTRASVRGGESGPGRRPKAAIRSIMPATTSPGYDIYPSDGRYSTANFVFESIAMIAIAVTGGRRRGWTPGDIRPAADCRPQAIASNASKSRERTGFIRTRLSRKRSVLDPSNFFSTSSEVRIERRPSAFKRDRPRLRATNESERTGRRAGAR